MKPIKVWAFLDSKGEIRSTTLPQEMLILHPKHYPNAVEVEIRQVKNRKEK